jgi:hypothetical protein
MNKSIKEKVITKKVRLGYVNLFSPTAMNESQMPKYGVCVYIPKTDEETLEKIHKAIESVKRKAITLWGGSVPNNIKTPLRDGDIERPGQEECAGHFFLNARSIHKPGIFDKNGHEILDSTEIYSGCYGRLSLDFYAYNKAGNKGITVGINSVMKLEDGEPLGGSRHSVNDFFKDDDKNDQNDFLY